MEASLTAELVEQMREVVRFATERGHTWPHYKMFLGPPPSERDEERLKVAVHYVLSV